MKNLVSYNHQAQPIIIDAHQADERPDTILGLQNDIELV